MTVRRAMAYVGVAGLIAAALSWYARNMPSHSEPARSSQCRNNLKQIALALYNYEGALDASRPRMWPTPAASRSIAGDCC